MPYSSARTETSRIALTYTVLRRLRHPLMTSREVFQERYGQFVAQQEDSLEVEPSASAALITGSAILSWPTAGLERFRPEDVESLLDQSADLLDRGLRDRAEWYTLSERAFRVALEIKEFQRLEEITTKEINSGRFTSIAAQSKAEWNLNYA
jgi:hypothetical protein